MRIHFLYLQLIQAQPVAYPGLLIPPLVSHQFLHLVHQEVQGFYSRHLPRMNVAETLKHYPPCWHWAMVGPRLLPDQCHSWWHHQNRFLPLQFVQDSHFL